MRLPARGRPVGCNAHGMRLRILPTVLLLASSFLACAAPANGVASDDITSNDGKLLDFPDCKAIMADLVTEAVKVAEKKGVHLTYSDPLEMVYRVAEKTGGNRSSMLQDFDRKRQSEIEFINGAIVREAEAMDLEVPVNRVLTLLVRALDSVHTE